MKRTILFYTLTLLTLDATAQFQLDIQGNARIQGRLALIKAVGDSTIIIGENAGINDNGNTKNIYIGANAGKQTTTGNVNMFIGHQSGQSNTTGNSNTFIGYLSGHENISGFANTFIGYQAGMANVNGFWNTFVGDQAGMDFTYGWSNTFIGKYAGQFSTGGNNNTFVGRNTGRVNTTGAANTFVGSSVGSRNTTGFFNTVIGGYSGGGLVNGSYNTFLGHFVGNSVINSTRMTFLGDQADQLVSTDSLDRSIAIGFKAKVECSNCAVIGGIGEDTVRVGIGITAPSHTLEVTRTTPIPANDGMALFEMNAPSNTNMDAAAIKGVNTIDDNWGFGVIGYGGAVGTQGLVRPQGNLGYIGAEGDAFHIDANGCSGSNTALGIGTYGRAWNNYTNRGVWGDARDGTVNYGVYGSASSNACGSSTDYAGYFNGNVHATGTISWVSDKRFKASVKSLDTALDLILRLRPTTYEYISKKYEPLNLAKGKQYGFIAQELKRVLPALVQKNIHIYAKDENASKPTVHQQLEYLGINYIALIPLLTKSIQEQQTLIQEQTKENNLLKERLSHIEKQFETLNQLVLKNISRDKGKREKTSNSFLNKVGKLDQNQPNPFNQNTIIKYFVPVHIQNAKIQIITLNGQPLESIPISNKGEGQLTIKANTFPNGTYYYSLILDGQISQTKKMVLIK